MQGDGWGHPGKSLIDFIRVTYAGAKRHILHPGKISDEFEMVNRVHQGRTLPPTVFFVINDVLNAVLAENTEGFVWRCHFFPYTSSTLRTSAWSLTELGALTK